MAIVAAIALCACVLQVAQSALVTLEAVVLRSHPLLPGVAAPALTRGEVEDVARLLRRIGVPGGRPAFEHGRLLAARWEAGGRTDPALAAAAIEAFAEAWAAAPHVPEHGVQYARILRETGAPLEDRVEVLDAVLARWPKDARPWLARAAHALQAGDETGAFRVAGERWLPWCSEGAFRARESGDLLALARAPDAHADPERLARCADYFERQGIEIPTLDDIRERFPRRGAQVAPQS